MPEGLDLYHAGPCEPVAMAGNALRVGCGIGALRRPNTFGKPCYPITETRDYVGTDEVLMNAPARDPKDKVRPCAGVVGSGITAWGAVANLQRRGFDVFLKGASYWPEGHPKAKLAKLLGVTVIDPKMPVGEMHLHCPMKRFDIVFDGSGDVPTAVELLAKSATGTVVCVFTIPGDPYEIATDWGTMFHAWTMKHIQPVPVVNGDPVDYEESAALLLWLEQNKPDFFRLLYDKEWKELGDMAAHSHEYFGKVMAQYHDFPIMTL
jgi:hypothetical protein